MADKMIHPGKLLEMSGAYWKTCTLHAGVALDVFTVIGDNSSTAEKVAGQIDADVDATARLLNALTAMSLLEKIQGTYANTETARRFLSKTSPQYIGFMIMHHHHLVASWSRLDEAVRTGRPVRSRASFDDDEFRESFLMGMFNNAMLTAPKLVPMVDLGGKQRLLDLGGGPGTYAIHFCKQYAGLKATVFDLKTSRPFAEKTIERFKLSDRINFAGGNYLTDEIPGKYDAVWMSHILHGESPEDARRLVKKAAGALEAGGVIGIHEFILENAEDGPLFPTLFSLNMLLGTDGGRAYSEKQLAEMLSNAGAKEVRRIPYQGPTESGVLIGNF